MRGIDRVFPDFDRREVHSIFLPAPRMRAWEALFAITAAELPITRVLMGLRSLPARLRRRRRPAPPGRPLIRELQAGGFLVLVEEPGRELVLGIIGQFWRIAGGRTASPPDRQAFEEFTQAGYAKAAMSFELADAGSGSRLLTETRILALDEGARRQFGRYWAVIRLGSGAIRWDILWAVRRRLRSA